ncbi:hypothetical protein FHG87_016705 [Trinorchestia longiramus]|nr:hypothetical protein FHG87_016705 [Trinorchestia longiramus]
MTSLTWLLRSCLLLVAVEQIFLRREARRLKLLFFCCDLRGKNIHDTVDQRWKRVPGLTNSMAPYSRQVSCYWCCIATHSASPTPVFLRVVRTAPLGALRKSKGAVGGYALNGGACVTV